MAQLRSRKRNHDIKLMRTLRGSDVRITHGLPESLARLETEPEEFKQKLVAFVDGLVSHYVLDDERRCDGHTPVPSRSGSTTRSASTQAASSAAG